MATPRSLREGLLNKLITVEDVVFWCWLTNSFGFINDKGAKYYNEQMHQLTEAVFANINKIIENPNRQDDFISYYLAQRASLVGLAEKPLPIDEKNF